jgi:hypothetical protein
LTLQIDFRNLDNTIGIDSWDGVSPDIAEFIIVENTAEDGI